MCEKIVYSQAALATGRDEDNNRFGWRIFDDSEVGRFRHSNHKGREVRDSKALEVDVHVQWPCAVNEKSGELPKVVIK